MGSKAYRQPPSLYRPVGFELAAPEGVQITPGPTLCCTETRDGKTVGQLEVAPFRAALIVDRDGILEEKVRAATGGAPRPVELPGASGFKAEKVASSEAMPYLRVFAFAPLGVDGGLLVVVRSVAPDWTAADSILQSLRVLTRGGPANDDNGPKMPFAP